MGQRLSKKVVDAIEPVPSRDVLVWDSELKGFGVRAKSSGTKSFIIQYRNRRGKSRRLTLGQYGRLTAEQARSMAKISLGEVEMGRDPATDLRTKRQAQTLTELCDIYFNDAQAGRVLYRGKPKKASTLSIDRGRINRHIKPILGQLIVEDITQSDIETFMHAIVEGKTAVDERTGPRGRARVTGGPGTAAKAVNLLSAIFAYAVKKQWVSANPCLGIERPIDQKRTRFLSASEYGALGNALYRAQKEGVSPAALVAIRAIALTGCRKSEILGLRANEIDPDGRCLRLSDSKSGPQVRPIGQAAIRCLLDSAIVDPSEFVFASRRGGGHLDNVSKPLARVCRIARLEGVSAHVLRHSFATTAHELGFSELTIAGLLGHAAGSITARYAHHVDHALAAAADQVSNVIQQRLVSETTG